jgi:hypothetical protein
MNKTTGPDWAKKKIPLLQIFILHTLFCKYNEQELKMKIAKLRSNYYLGYIFFIKRLILIFKLKTVERATEIQIKMWSAIK